MCSLKSWDMRREGNKSDIFILYGLRFGFHQLVLFSLKLYNNSRFKIQTTQSKLKTVVIFLFRRSVVLNS